MLFSSKPVAEFLNTTFEPAWESARPAPLVTVDFGNGRVVRRTLRGNVTTTVCTPAGDVVDILPGIYTPDIYRAQLAACAAQAGKFKGLHADFLTRALNDYHADRLAAMRPPDPPAARVAAGIGGGIKGGIGGGIAGNGFAGAPPGGIAGGFGGNVQTGNEFGGNIQGRPPTVLPGIEGPTEAVLAGADPRAVRAAPVTAAGLATHPGLLLDARANEQVRRAQVHARLRTAGRVRPADIRSWVFKDVLGTDLADPLLGLGPLLSAGYPFADEDGAPARE